MANPNEPAVQQPAVPWQGAPQNDQPDGLPAAAQPAAMPAAAPPVSPPPIAPMPPISPPVAQPPGSIGKLPPPPQSMFAQAAQPLQPPQLMAAPVGQPPLSPPPPQPAMQQPVPHATTESDRSVQPTASPRPPAPPPPLKPVLQPQLAPQTFELPSIDRQQSAPQAIAAPTPTLEDPMRRGSLGDFQALMAKLDTYVPPSLSTQTATPESPQASQPAPTAVREPTPQQVPDAPAVASNAEVEDRSQPLAAQPAPSQSPLQSASQTPVPPAHSQFLDAVEESGSAHVHPEEPAVPGRIKQRPHSVFANDITDEDLPDIRPGQFYEDAVVANAAQEQAVLTAAPVAPEPPPQPPTAPTAPSRAAYSGPTEFAPVVSHPETQHHQPAPLIATEIVIDSFADDAPAALDTVDQVAGAGTGQLIASEPAQPVFAGTQIAIEDAEPDDIDPALKALALEAQSTYNPFAENDEPADEQGGDQEQPAVTPQQAQTSSAAAQSQDHPQSGLQAPTPVREIADVFGPPGPQPATQSSPLEATGFDSIGQAGVELPRPVTEQPSSAARPAPAMPSGQVESVVEDVVVPRAETDAGPHSSLPESGTRPVTPPQIDAQEHSGPIVSPAPEVAQQVTEVELSAEPAQPQTASAPTEQHFVPQQPVETSPADLVEQVATAPAQAQRAEPQEHEQQPQAQGAAESRHASERSNDLSSDQTEARDTSLTLGGTKAAAHNDVQIEEPTPQQEEAVLIPPQQADPAEPVLHQTQQALPAGAEAGELRSDGSDGQTDQLQPSAGTQTALQHENVELEPPPQSDLNQQDAEPETGIAAERQTADLSPREAGQRQMHEPEVDAAVVQPETARPSGSAEGASATLSLFESALDEFNDDSMSLEQLIAEVTAVPDVVSPDDEIEVDVASKDDQAGTGGKSETVQSASPSEREGDNDPVERLPEPPAAVEDAPPGTVDIEAEATDDNAAAEHQSWPSENAIIADEEEFAADKIDPQAGETARMLLDIMSKPSGAAQPQERALAADTLLRLLPKIPVTNLVALAERICMMETPPPLLVNKMLRHPRHEVAGPLLEGCSGISDQVLMAVISSRDYDKQRMIAKRRSLSPQMCDALIEFGDTSVFLTIVRNPGASLSHDAFMNLSEIAKTQTSLQAPLVTRGDTPAPIAFELFWFLPSELRRYVLSRFLTDSETLDKILKITLSVDGAEAGDTQEARSIDKRKLAKLVDDVATGDVEVASATLADVAGINRNNARRIISDTEGEPITVAMKAIGYPRTEYSHVVERWRGGSAVLSRSERPTAELQNLFDSLSFNKARMLLTYWDWAAGKTGPYARKAA